MGNTTLMCSYGVHHHDDKVLLPKKVRIKKRKKVNATPIKPLCTNRVQGSSGQNASTKSFNHVNPTVDTVDVVIEKVYKVKLPTN